MYGEPVLLQLNPDGAPNLLVRGQALHSRRDPEREADRIATEICAALRPGSPLLVIGIGCGYIWNALHRKAPGALAQDLFLYEPLDQARHASRPDSGGVAVDRTGILGSPTEVAAILSTNTRLFLLPQWRRLFPDLVERIGRTLSDPHAATQHHFFRSWSRNFFTRINRTAPLPFLVRSTEPVFKRVIYCGAGPSLPADLASKSQLLEEPGTLLLASDTALAPLIGGGCEPDLVLSVDSGPGTAYHFLALQGLCALPFEIPVLSWTAGSTVLEGFARSVLFYRSSFPYDQLLETGPLRDVPEFSNASGNAAGLARIVAEALGAPELHLLGTSFRTARYDSHVRGTGYDIYANLRRTRVFPPESYRRRGYGADISPAHTRALGALEQDAADAGIALYPSPPPQKDSKDGPRAFPRRGRRMNLPFPLVNIRGSDVATFLREHGPRLPAHLLPDGGRTARRLL